MRISSRFCVHLRRSPTLKRTFIMKDVRVFVNTILHGLNLMKQEALLPE